MRNAIIYYSNKYIKKFIDDDTIYCNVDCIISLRPRYDIPVGKEIGQFKIEHECEDFKYKMNGIYQWGKDGKDVHYIGIPKNLLSDIEDISSWQKNLKYIFNEKERRIKENVKKK